MDAVGVAITQMQEAWSPRRITAALLMVLASAFPSVARGCLFRKMRGMCLDECLVRWTDNFMRGRWVIVNIGGQDGEPVEATTGLPQGSPISPLLSCYIHRRHPCAVEGSRGISFVDDVTSSA